ncbi:MAG TPA: response regulator [Candidatus Polarisedimenticolia bacterium]|jgi:signal transduction histidine kinase
MSAEPANRIESILVVDDTLQNIQLVEANLVTEGYNVIPADTGEKAIEMFERQPPDLVLLDILMPGMDGFETCRRLRTMLGGAGTPIVFLTALGDLGTHQTALESGADDFLTKPLNRTELLMRVRSLLRLKHMHDEVTSSHQLIASQRDTLLYVERQKEELTSFVVHDLKNPLTGILANAQLLDRDKSLAERSRASVRDILTGAQTLHRMVMNLVDISRSESGALVPSMSDLDLRGLIEEVARTVNRRAESRNQTLAIDVAPEAGTLRADRDLVRRILENLLDNSLKYSPAGGRIGIEARASGDAFVEVRVGDEGEGIPESYRRKIFDKYGKLDRDQEAQVREGRAMGLTYCRYAAEAHGGRIWVEDNHPAGSVFCVTLPLGHGAAAAPGRASVVRAEGT